MRILFVEDDKKITDALEELCLFQGLECDVVNDGLTGLSLALNPIYDMIVLDIMLPNVNGMDILKAIRSNNINCPVMILSAKGEIEDKVKALDWGADDYLVKPFSAKELFARIRALCRRTEDNIKGESPIVFENVVFNSDRNSIFFDGTEAKLSNKEARIFEVLIKNPNKTINRDYIIEKVWGSEAKGSKENNLEIYIHNIRKKLKNSRIRIDTVRGVGYILSSVALSSTQ